MPISSMTRPLVAALLAARACGEEPPPPPVAVAPIGGPMAVATVAPSRGGVMVAAGPAQLEVVSHASGEVYAYPAAGLATPARAEVTVEVGVEGGRRPVAMRWDGRERRYVGRVQGVRVVPGPANVTVVVSGVRHVGWIPVVVVAPAVVVGVPGVVIDVHHGKHKHKHRGHGYGHGHGHGARVRIH